MLFGKTSLKPLRVKRLFTLSFTFIALTALMAAQPTTLFAQPPQPTPPGMPEADAPIIPMLPPETEAELEAEREAATSYLMSRTITDYRVAYLISEETTQRYVHLSPKAMNERAGAGVLSFSRWEDFLREDEAQPFDIVLLHGSMLDQIDAEWTQAAYRAGVILPGINLTHAQMSELTGNQCLTNPNRNIVYEEMYKDFVVYSIYQVVTSAEEIELETVHRRFLEVCGEDVTSGNEPATVTTGTLQTGLEDTTEYADWLIRFLTAEAADRDYKRLRLIAGDKLE